MNDELLWNAIEGALGTEKMAYLRYAPLSTITGARDLPTAVAAHASAHHEKKAFWNTVGRGLRSLEKVAKASPPDNRPYPPNTSLVRKIAIAQKARLLEQGLEGSENVKIASVRKEVDKDIFEALIKQANVLSGAIKNPAARELSESVIEGGKDLGKKVLTGAALGTGAAVPLYIGGSALSDKATEDARNRALQTAAGVGGMAMLGYGANRLMDNMAYHNRHKQAEWGANELRVEWKDYNDGRAGSIVAPTGEVLVPDAFSENTPPEAIQASLQQVAGLLGKPPEEILGPYAQNKQASSDDIFEKISSLTATVYIDQFLDQVDQTEKVAALREVNRDYGVTLLCELEKHAQDKEMPSGTDPGTPIGKGWATDYNTLPYSNMAGRAKAVAENMADKKKSKKEKKQKKESEFLNKDQQPQSAELVRPEEGSVDPLTYFQNREKEANAANRALIGMVPGMLAGGVGGHLATGDPTLGERIEGTVMGPLDDRYGNFSPYEARHLSNILGGAALGGGLGAGVGAISQPAINALRRLFGSSAGQTH